MRSQLNAINRKQSGRYSYLFHFCRMYSVLFYYASLVDWPFVYVSLAVRDLSNLVKPEDIVTSEHLVTLLAIVPNYSQKDWLSSYETLTNYVVNINIFSFHVPTAAKPKCSYIHNAISPMDLFIISFEFPDSSLIT